MVSDKTVFLAFGKKLYDTVKQWGSDEPSVIEYLPQTEVDPKLSEIKEKLNNVKVRLKTLKLSPETLKWDQYHVEDLETERLPNFSS